jgi:hypothetical protein
MADVFNSEVPAPSTSDLVGEGKKFKDVDALVKGKVEADNFIEQLKAELAGARSQIEAQATTAQQLEQLKNELAQRQAAPTQPRVQTEPALTASDIEALVERTVTSRDRNRTAAQNIEMANTSAIKHFGSAEAASAAVKAASTKRGISVQKLKEIAAESPTTFAELVGVPTAPVASAVGSFVQPSAGTPDKEHMSAEQKPGTYEFAESIRRTDPRKYWSPSFQQKYVWEATKAGTYKPN